MNSQQLQLLNLRNLPARLNVEETARLLGFKPHDITILMSAGLLRPLGHPLTTGVKYFAAVTIEEYQRDTKWLARASDRIVHFWRTTNLKRKSNDAPPDQ